MGCVASRKGEENDVVFLCRERKRLLKLVMDRRYAFADAQLKYNQSLYSVAMAIRSFVDQYSSSPSSPFLITFPSSSKLEETHDVDCLDDDDDNVGDSSDVDGDEVACEHFYDEVATQNSSPNRSFGWDFFDPFDKGVKTDVVNSDTSELGHDNCGFDDVKAEQENKIGLKMVGLENGRELLEALKHVEDHFLRAHDSGLDVSKMLEASKVQFLSSFEGIKENSSKLIRSMTWNQRRTTLYRSLSRKSLLSSSSRSASTCMESTNGIFSSNGRMESGNHSLTLETLYAWETKLYREVKIGEEMRKIHKQRCFLSKNKCAKDKELYTGILVVLRGTESISERIQKLIDEELQPQMLELLHGLMRNWMIMMETHETQHRTMYEATAFNCPAYGKFRNDSHRLATLQLQAGLHHWHACFAFYIATQKDYIEALFSWLSKFLTPQVEFSFIRRTNELPLLRVCHDWLVCLKALPDKAVTSAMKSFGKDVYAIWIQEGEEQQQKKKVDGLAKELDRKVLAFKKTENKILELKKVSDEESKVNLKEQIECLSERKKRLELFRKRLDAEKTKHRIRMQQTQKITINGFQMGFSAVFESLARFSKASVQMYGNLVTYNKKTREEVA